MNTAECTYCKHTNKVVRVANNNWVGICAHCNHVYTARTQVVTQIAGHFLTGAEIVMLTCLVIIASGEGEVAKRAQQSLDLARVLLSKR